MVLTGGGGRGEEALAITNPTLFTTLTAPLQDKIRDEFTKYDTDKNGVITRGEISLQSLDFKLILFLVTFQNGKSDIKT